MFKKMTKLPRYLGLVLIPAAWLGINAASHASTYSLVDYSDATHTLSGTITTDGTLGSLGVANITEWSVTVTGSDNFTFFSTDPFAGVTDFGSLPTVTASLSDIVITGNGYFALLGNTISSLPQYRYNNGDALVWRPDGLNLYNMNVGNSGQYIYATVSDAIPAVPLPATFWLFGTALVGFIGISRKTKVT